MLKLHKNFQSPNHRNFDSLTDEMTKELAGLDDMIFECEMYNQSQRKTVFVETSSDDDDSVDLDNVRISELNIQDNPLYTTGL